MSSRAPTSREGILGGRRADHLSPFETPVFVFKLDRDGALDREIAALLLAERQSSAGIARSNRGTWHSIPDLAMRQDRCLCNLMEIIIDHVRFVFDELARGRKADISLSFRYAVQGWAMIMQRGDYAIVHDHAEAHWSTVYYIDAGEQAPKDHPDAGALAFLDPRQGVGGIPGVDIYPSTLTVRPQNQMLVVFPGWLRHYVHPYRGDRPRISIACNLRMELGPA